MSDKIRKLVVGTCLVVLVLNLLLIVYLSSYWRLCGRVNDKPEIIPSELPIVWSKDARVLMRFGGYLELKNSQSSPPATNSSKQDVQYMQLEAISELIVTSENDTQTLNVTTICGKMTMSLHTHENKRVCQYIEIDLGSNGYCWIERPGIESKIGAHYVCLKEKKFDCKQVNDSALVAANHFYMSGLEFEIDKYSGSDDHKHEKFSTPEQYCDDTTKTV